MRWSWYKANALCKISIVHYASDEKVGTTTELYAKSEGKINSAPRFAILLLTEQLHSISKQPVQTRKYANANGVYGQL